MRSSPVYRREVLERSKAPPCSDLSHRTRFLNWRGTRQKNPDVEGAGGPKSVLRFVAQFLLTAKKKCGVLRSQNREFSRNRRIIKVFLRIESLPPLGLSLRNGEKAGPRVPNPETVMTGCPPEYTAEGTDELADELVVDDRSGQEIRRSFRIFCLFLLGDSILVLSSDDSPLAKHVPILLAGDLLWHFEDHFD
jgi:hypothetical protein